MEHGGSVHRLLRGEAEGSMQCSSLKQNHASGGGVAVHWHQQHGAGTTKTTVTTGDDAAAAGTGEKGTVTGTVAVAPSLVSEDNSDDPKSGGQ